MARKGFGAAVNRMLNFVGLVDTDQEPQRSGRNDEYESSDRSGYTPAPRRNDRPVRPQNGGRSNGNPQRYGNNGGFSGNASYGNSGRSNPVTRSGNRNPRDPYDEWNTAPRKKNRYADEIYDSDTTLQGESAYDDDYGYEGRHVNRNGRRPDEERMNTRRPTEAQPEERRPATVDNRPARTSHATEVVVFDVNDLEDCRMVILALIDNKTVIISVEALDKATIRRVEDTLCGAVCALNATIRRTSEVSYVIAPSSIEVKGTRRTVERRY